MLNTIELKAADEGQTTYISADFHVLLQRQFMLGQTQTASSGPIHAEQFELERGTWQRISGAISQTQLYDPTIIRFYENLVAELSRELARYKELVAELLLLHDVQAEAEYTPGERVSLPVEVLAKMRRATQRGLTMSGHEI